MPSYQGDPVLQRYERIAFEKELIAVPGRPLAAYVCPGHPLLESTIDLIIERNLDLLKRGAVLVDEADQGEEVRTLVYLEHSVQDARVDRLGERRVVSKQMQFVEIDNQGNTMAAGYAPYLNYRPLTQEEVAVLPHVPEPPWVRNELESRVLEYAAAHLVPAHLGEVKLRKESLTDKTTAAVKERLTKEINYWDHRAAQLKDQELAGKTNAKLNSGLARQRADELTARLQKRMAELDQERKISPLPPVVMGAALVVPIGLMSRLLGRAPQTPTFAADTKRSEQLALCAVMEAERRLGYTPRDVSAEKLGYDVESSSRVRALKKWYVLDVSSEARVWLSSPKRLRSGKAAERPITVAAAMSRLPAGAWKKMTVAEGSQGPRVYEYAEMFAWFSEEGRPTPTFERLLFRRSIGQEAEVKFQRSNAPLQIKLQRLAEVGGSRWTIEQDFQAGKGECGLDEYETRGWVGWHHHTALSMLALLFLVLQRQRLGKKRASDECSRSACRVEAFA